jgi:hypothetical protein
MIYHSLGACNPKNAILDTMVIVIILLVLAIVSVIGYSVFTEVNDDIMADDTMISEAQDISNELHGKYPPLMDNLFLFAFVLLVVFVVISVFMLDTHPIFFIITIVLLIAVFVVAMLLANVYDEVMTDATFASSANLFPYMSWINDNLLGLVIGIGFLISIVLFIKFKG